MQKNYLLIMLACLNCVHTTHAGGDALVPAREKIKESMLEGWLNEKTPHYKFQGMCFDVGRRINDPDMIQGASVQTAQILLDITTKWKDKIPHIEPDWLVIAEVENVRRDIVNDLKNLKKADIKNLMHNNDVVSVSSYISDLFHTKLEEQFKAGKFTELTVDTELDHPYEKALYSRIPYLNCASYLYVGPRFLPLNFPFDDPSLNRLLTQGFGAYRLESSMTDLKNNYPDMEQPVWDIYKKVLRHQLNDYIRGNGDQFDIGDGIENYLLNKPGIKQVTETILDTICQNLNLDQKTDLYQRTVKELNKSETLHRLVSNYIEQKYATDGTGKHNGT